MFLKVVQQLTDRQALTLRGSYYDEDSQVTYSGLTLAEWEDDPRGNPFRNDYMYATHWGTSATHQFDVNDGAKLLTSAYYTYFNRDWWRQSSNSGQRPNDSSDPACGGLANLDTTCGNEGRLRQYWTAGIEPRLNLEHTLFGVENVLDTGLRYHQEQPVPGAGERRHAGRTAARHGPQCRHQGGQRPRGDGLVRVRAEPLRPRALHGHARPALRARGLPARRQPARQPRHRERGRVDPRHRRDVRGGAWHDGIRRRASRILAAGRRGHHHAHRRHGGPRPRILLELRARHPQRRAQRPVCGGHPFPSRLREPDRSGECRRRHRRRAHERGPDAAGRPRGRGQHREQRLRGLARRRVRSPVLDLAVDGGVRRRPLQHRARLDEQ